MNFNFITDDNRQPILNWDNVLQYVSRYKPQTSFEFSVTRRQPKKSNPMRKYYFAVVMPKLVDTLGYERDEILDVHKQLKIRYFNVEPDKRGIYRNKDIPSVFGDDSELPVSDKKKFQDWVIRKCAEAGGYVPDPE